MKILSDPVIERGLLSNLINFGSLCYHDVSDLDLSDATFTIDSNRVIFKCIDKIFKQNDDIIPDIPLIYSTASELGLKSWFQKDSEVLYLNSIIEFPADKSNTRTFALQIKKLEIARNINQRLEEAKNDTLEVTGKESINDIFGIIEKTIIDCSKFLSKEKSASLLSEGTEAYFLNLEQNPIDQIGISTGFPCYDHSIGGGLRNGSVNVIAARAKVGKSTLAINMAMNVSKLNVPVLYLDSEMGKNDSINRIIACLSEINIDDIETGKYTKFKKNTEKVHQAINLLKTLPIFYESIAGQAFENQVSLIKRWLITEVGLKNNGLANPCVIIYDYLKLMAEEDANGYQEYQKIGFLMTSLVNFAQKYNIPVLSFVQTNRDGISKEDASVVSLSDRIVWFCSSLTIFKRKDINEIELDNTGNRKLVVTDSRFGPGLYPGDYINCNFNGAIAKILEGKLTSEIRREQKQQATLLDTENADQTTEPIIF